MTPPDSGERCTWIVNGERSGRCVLRSNHAGAHEPDDPRDSGEREVTKPVHTPPCPCGWRGCAKHHGGIAVPMPLAQRILAALAVEADRPGGMYMRVLASELRAAVERNSGKECGHLLSADLGAEWRCGKPVGHEGPHSGTKP